jgi:hypothetical protein
VVSGDRLTGPHVRSQMWANPSEGERWGLMRWAVSCVPFLLLTQMHSSLFTLHHLSLLFMGNYTCYRLGSEITHTFASRFLRDQKVGPHLEGPRYNKGVSVRNTTSTEKNKKETNNTYLLPTVIKECCNVALLYWLYITRF